MKTTLVTIGINIEQLKSKPIHNRLETEDILDITNKTLKKYERNGMLNKVSYKNKNYYTSESIQNCIAKQLNLPLTSQNVEWNSIW